MNLDEPNIVLIDLRCPLPPEISRRMPAQAQFPLPEILLPPGEQAQIRFTWSRAMANHFVYKTFPCPLGLGRILPSALNASAKTDILLVCRLAPRGGHVPPTKIRH